MNKKIEEINMELKELNSKINVQGPGVLLVLDGVGLNKNAVGNAIFNAALMLALPDENRGAILGFVSAASMGGCALSAVVYGVLGDLFPLHLVFVAGCILALPFALYLFCHRNVREFILTH